jgi:hypothetical protein
VYPIQSPVYAYSSPTLIAVAQKSNSPRGDVLPGFSLPLDSLFATEDEPE